MPKSCRRQHLIVIHSAPEHHSYKNGKGFQIKSGTDRTSETDYGRESASSAQYPLEDATDTTRDSQMKP